MSKLHNDARIADEVVHRLSTMVRSLHARVTGTCLPRVPHSLPHSWEACVNEFPDENSLSPFRGEELQWSADFKKVPSPRNSFARLMASGKDWPPEYQLSQVPVGETFRWATSRRQDLAIAGILAASPFPMPSIWQTSFWALAPS